MAVFTDQTEQSITLDHFPRRIVSLVPSQTELLYDLGLDEEVVGITKFCVHPQSWFRSKTRVGGTKQVKPEVIHQLQPDLIIANKEENVKEQVEELARHYPVWISDVNDLASACDMIGQVGQLTGKAEAAAKMALKIAARFKELPTLNYRLQTVYLIWQNPYMTVGGDTFIHAMLQVAGFDNLFAPQTRYPEITIDTLQELKPELLLLSSEPFPFRQKHVEELKQLLPGTQVLLVDGELFSWYGSRLLQAPAYFEALRDQIRNL